MYAYSQSFLYIRKKSCIVLQNVSLLLHSTFKVNVLFVDSKPNRSAEKPLLCMIKSYEETAVFN